MLYVDTPTLQEFKKLNGVRADACVSLYLQTTPVTQDVEASRIEMGNLVKDAIAQTEALGLDKRRVAALGEQFDDLLDDDEFWRFQAHSLAVFATPERIATFRLANRLPSVVEVADRYYLKPLLRAITFPHDALVLQLSENNVRLVEIFSDLPAQEVSVPNFPKDAASANKMSTVNDRSAKRRITGSEGQKVRLTNYARQVDSALRNVLAGRDLPLILAPSQQLDSIFRSINSSGKLADESLSGLNDRSTPTEIAQAARPVLDGIYAAEIAEFKSVYDRRKSDRRTTTDISDAARAATFGGIETLLVDFETMVHGTIDEQTGEVAFGKAGPETFGVVDEIMSRALVSGARVLAVRAEDLPADKPLAATLRYAI